MSECLTMEEMERNLQVAKHVERYCISFGATAFEPISDEGKQWCANHIVDNIDNGDFFVYGDACVEGFNEGSFAVCGRDAPDFVADLYDTFAECV